MTSAASSSKSLRAKIALALPSARPEQLWQRADRIHVTALQLRNFDVVRASVPLLDEAIHACLMVRGDPVARRMINYLGAHRDEEREHAAWLREDLAVMGVEPDAGPPSVIAAELVGAQFYWINFDHPVALLGYMAVLEGCTARVQWVEGFIERTGYPRAGLRTLLHHARVDPGHSADLDQLIDFLPLTGRHIETMGVSAVYTATKLLELGGADRTEPVEVPGALAAPLVGARAAAAPDQL